MINSKVEVHSPPPPPYKKENTFSPILSHALHFLGYNHRFMVDFHTAIFYGKPSNSIFFKLFGNETYKLRMVVNIYGTKNVIGF